MAQSTDVRHPGTLEVENPSSKQCFELKSIEQDVRCSICLSHFTQPKTLACGHTFCGGCVIALLNAACEAVVCPKCKQTHPKCNVATLTVNTTLERIAWLLRLEHNEILIDSWSQRHGCLDRMRTGHFEAKLLNKVQFGSALFRHTSTVATLQSDTELVCATRDHITWFSDTGDYIVHSADVENCKDLQTHGATTYALIDLHSDSEKEPLFDKQTGFYWWRIIAFNHRGEEEKTFPAGLGKRSRMTVTTAQDIVLVDSGDTQYNAAPCLIILDKHGGRRKTILCGEGERIRQPWCIAALPEGDIVVYDAGDATLKRIKILTNEIEVSWRQEVLGVQGVAANRNGLIWLTVKEGLIAVSGDGQILGSIAMKRNTEKLAVACNDRRIAVVTDRGVLIYEVSCEIPQRIA